MIFSDIMYICQNVLDCYWTFCLVHLALFFKRLKYFQVVIAPNKTQYKIRKHILKRNICIVFHRPVFSTSIDIEEWLHVEQGICINAFINLKTGQGQGKQKQKNSVHPQAVGC